MIKCAREGCSEEFVKRTHNQKYHDDECCKLATNVRMMEKYYRRKAQQSGQTRYCSVCFNTKLSRYNDSTVCSGCQMSREVSMNNSVASMLASVKWSLETA